MPKEFYSVAVFMSLCNFGLSKGFSKSQLLGLKSFLSISVPVVFEILDLEGPASFFLSTFWRFSRFTSYKESFHVMTHFHILSGNFCLEYMIKTALPLSTPTCCSSFWCWWIWDRFLFIVLASTKDDFSITGDCTACLTGVFLFFIFVDFTVLLWNPSGFSYWTSHFSVVVFTKHTLRFSFIHSLPSKWLFKFFYICVEGNDLNY